MHIYTITSEEREPELEVWTAEEPDMYSDDDMPPNTEPLQDNEHDKENQAALNLSRWFNAFILILQAKYHLSNQVINLLLKFFMIFFCILGKFSDLCDKISKHLSPSLYKAMKENQCNVSFQRYVTCKRCHKIYYYNDCIEGSGNYQRSKHCICNPFGKKMCGQLLLKTVELSSGKRLLRPLLTYCYLGIKAPLQSLLLRPGFTEMCDKWRSRKISDNILSDVYDGKVWKEFQSYQNKPFLSEPFSFAVMINVDWFQPYKHVTHSVGVIFMTVMNLPRASRYIEDNVILVGIIPGPNEPHFTVNSYLDLLIDELLELWSGVELSTAVGKRKIRCAVLCASCDIPAGRKLCGFLGHMAYFGCTKCKKGFPGGIGNKDYSGYDRQNWTARTNEAHRRDALNLLKCRTKTEMAQKESSYGCRYSSLPYFDAPRMLVVDPMHNLFTGTAKHYIHRVWLKNNILSDFQFAVIQDRVNRTMAPPDIGRIPLKIQSGFASFTADQFKNWTVYSSIMALHDILINRDLECWRHFVLCCRLLCSRQISTEQVKLADALILQFCRRTEEMYGKEVTTPNMHLHCHLFSCIEDFGPISGFWLFPYERYNGILGELPNNNHSIEVQLMKRFLNDQSICQVTVPAQFSEEFKSLVDFNLHGKCVGSVGDTLDPFKLNAAMTLSWDVTDLLDKCIVLPNYFTRGVFDASQLQNLRHLYSNMYSTPEVEIYVNSSFQKYKSLTVSGKILGSFRSPSHSSSLVMARWNSKCFGSNSSNVSQVVCRPLQIQFFVKHPIVINKKLYTHILARVNWFKKHPLQEEYGKPVTVWHHDLFESSGIHDIIPIQLLQMRTVSLVDKIDDVHGSALFVCPCIDF